MFGFHLKYFCPKCKQILWFWNVRRQTNHLPGNAYYYTWKCLNCANEKDVCSRQDAINSLLQNSEV